MFPGKITDVPGLWLGHAQDESALTGVTALYFPDRAVTGVCVQGGAPGTRETALLEPGKNNRKADALLLCGGSAFGLAAADGAMRWLEERGRGVEVGGFHVPIVPAAVIFDLAVGDGRVRPDADMGYAALSACSAGEARQGAVGAGIGATIGKALPGAAPGRGGIGMASMTLGQTTIAAVIVVNAFGDVYDYRDGSLIAAGSLGGSQQAIMSEQVLQMWAGMGAKEPVAGNTVIGAVATDAALDKEQAARLASVAHDGLAMAVRPTHTPYDGDTLFAVSTGGQAADFALLCAAAPLVVARAIANAAWLGQETQAP